MISILIILKRNYENKNMYMHDENMFNTEQELRLIMAEVIGCLPEEIDSDYWEF